MKLLFFMALSLLLAGIVFYGVYKTMNPHRYDQFDVK